MNGRARDRRTRLCTITDRRYRREARYCVRRVRCKQVSRPSPYPFLVYARPSWSITTFSFTTVSRRRTAWSVWCLRARRLRRDVKVSERTAHKLLDKDRLVFRTRALHHILICIYIYTYYIFAYEMFYSITRIYVFCFYLYACGVRRKNRNN